MAGTWYYTLDGKTKAGPLSLDAMRQLIRAGQLKSSHMVRPEDTPKWSAAGTFAELFPASVPSQSGRPPAPTLPKPDNARAESPSSEPSPLVQVGTGVGRILVACGSVLRAAGNDSYRRVSLWRLRRRQCRQQQRQDKFLGELGVRLLSTNVIVPDAKTLIPRFRGLSQAQQLAKAAAHAGNKEKRKAAAQLADELWRLYMDYGRAALGSSMSFEGRSERVAFWRQSKDDVAATQKKIDARLAQLAATSPATKWGVRLGLASAAAVFLTIGVGWAMGFANAARPQTVENPIAAAVDQPGKRQSLQELFVRLAPATPLVEAVESASGSGFFIKQGDKYLVVTNRHVVEDARKGLAVHFLQDDGQGAEKRFTVPPAKTSVIAIHRSADVAIVDVSAAAADIDRLQIVPVRLAPPGHKPQVGEHVFAIGHPGGEESRLLTRTLSDGIVSAVGRKYEDSRFLQVTVPINPGNSGGPLFDDEGRVVGVNTFGIRRSPGRTITLEALNFSLELDFVHEILSDPEGKSMDAKTIASIVSPNITDDVSSLTAAVEGKVRGLVNGGYKPVNGSVESSTRVFRMAAESRRQFRIYFEGKRNYTMVTVSQRPTQLFLAAIDSRGAVIGAETEASSDPQMAFQTGNSGLYSLIVLNPTKTETAVALVILKK